MSNVDKLRTKTCQPCERGTPPLPRKQVTALLRDLEHWTLLRQGKRIRRKIIFDDFAEAIAFINRVAELAESEGHHPDLHLTDYKQLAIELTTHAIHALSENDFILAAKIDEIADEDGIEDESE